MEAIIQPTNLRPETFVGLATAFCTLTATVIGIRLYSNHDHSRKLYADDYLCLVALLMLIWNSVTFGFLMYMFDKDPRTVTIEYLTRLVSVGIASGNCAVFSAKLPLLFLYIRTFGIATWVRWSCQFLVAAGLVGGLVTLLYAGINCSPDLHTVSPLFMFSCVTALTDATIARGSISLALDVIMFILPLPVIAQLNMPLRRKIGLGFVFATGLVAIAASALGLYFQTVQNDATSSNFANALLVTVIESAIVVLVSCAPALHLFWAKYAQPLRSRLGLSRLTTGASKSKTTGLSSSGLGRRSKLQGGPHLPDESSSTERIQVTTHHYVELQEYPGAEKPLYEARASSTPNAYDREQHHRDHV